MTVNVYRTPGDTTENVIHAGRCRLLGIYPELASNTGTVTIRNTATAAAGTATHICAIGLLAAGKTFGPNGVLLDTGLTVQLSVATDLCAIVWEAV